MSAEYRHDIENLCLDMNGIFHEATQKIYEYGNHARPKSKIHVEVTPLHPNVLRKRTFEEIGKIVNNLVYRVRPTKTVLIMVDGPAGLGKQYQQRSRRYRSATDTEKKFDTNCISAGTEWMDFVSKFLDQFIRRQITSNPIWKGLTVVFSNSSVAGEGEHKAFNYIKKHGSPKESYVIYGLDADLIMLALSTQNTLSSNGYELNPPKFYILREDQYSNVPTLLVINVSLLRQFFIEELTWGLECSRNGLIDDYIFLCFLLGNDFLPHSPSIDLIEGGLEILFESYSSACANNGSHLITSEVASTRSDNDEHKCLFNKNVLKDILYAISLKEKNILVNSVKCGEKFADPLLEKFTSAESKTSESVESEASENLFEDTSTKTFDFEGYQTEYYTLKIPNTTPERICHEYFRGMEWVYKYYTTGIPSWDWTYPYFYAPFSKDMVKYIDTYDSKPFVKGRPMELFKQLLSILPPQSASLLPTQLQPIIEKFPREIKIDLAGKKFEWQGIVIVPTIPDFQNDLKRVLDSMTVQEKRRNFLGKEYVYRKVEGLLYEHSTYYGTFMSSAEVKIFS